MIPGGDVAGVAAVLPVPPGIVAEWLSADRAYALDGAAPVDIITVRTPVSGAAGIRAKPPCPVPGWRQSTTALRAHVPGRRLRRWLRCPVAPRLHGGACHAQCSGDLSEAVAFLPKLLCLSALFIPGHGAPPACSISLFCSDSRGAYVDIPAQKAPHKMSFTALGTEGGAFGHPKTKKRRSAEANRREAGIIR